MFGDMKFLILAVVEPIVGPSPAFQPTVLHVHSTQRNLTLGLPGLFYLVSPLPVVGK